MKFNESELKVLEISKSFRDADVPVFNTPVGLKEGWKAMAAKKPHWCCNNIEVFSFYPDIIPDNRCRGFVNDGGVVLTAEEKGGIDMFGVEWVWIPVANGSMEKPGNPHPLEDANDWEEKLTWPDVDSWDWEGCAARNKEYLNNGKFNYITFLNGFGFERLISLFGFENAAMALLDDDQEDALLALLDKLSDLYCKIVDKCVKYFNIDGFVVHDDWGSQRDPFFSFEVGQKFFVPNMKKVTDRIHSYGLVAELHSCGKNEKQIENFIAGGWDIWAPMANINDTQMLFEKFGDKIIIGVCPDAYDRNASEEEIRASAQAFVDKYCSDPNKVCVINRYFSNYLYGAYAEELYKASRLVYENN